MRNNSGGNKTEMFSSDTTVQQKDDRPKMGNVAQPSSPIALPGELYFLLSWILLWQVFKNDLKFMCMYVHGNM